MEKSENKRVDVGIIRKISDTLSGIGNYASKKSERGLYKTMQKTECISLCEIMHDLYQKEPNVEKLIDRACKEAGFSKCERIYFGSSFCGQYFLNMSRKEINLLVEACKKQNIKLTMVLPIFTEKHLERAKKKIESYISELREVLDEVTVNDYGMLVYLHTHYSHLKLNMGRLFMKDYRDPRYEDYFNQTLKPKAFTTYLKKLVQDYHIGSIEFDPSHKSIDMSEKPEGIIIALYTPYCYETVGQICQMAGISQPIEKKFRPNEPCQQECNTHKIHYFIEEGHTWLKLGRAIYFKNESCEIKGVNCMRVIYSLLDWEVEQ